jgi:hypothetical protein
MGTPGTNVVLAIQPPGSSRISTLKLLRRVATALSVQPQAPPSLRHQHMDLAKSLRQASESDDLRHAALSPTAASSTKSKPPAERQKPFAASSLPSLSSFSMPCDDLERVVEQRARALVQVGRRAERMTAGHRRGMEPGGKGRRQQQAGRSGMLGQRSRAARDAAPAALAREKPFRAARTASWGRCAQAPRAQPSCVWPLAGEKGGRAFSRCDGEGGVAGALGPVGLGRDSGPLSGHLLPWEA